MNNRNIKNLFSAPVVALATLGFITACGGGSGSGTTNPVSDPAALTPTGADTINPSPTPVLNPPNENPVVDPAPAPNQIVTPSNNPPTNNPEVTPEPTNLTNIQDVFNASSLAEAGDEVYLVVRNNQIFLFDYQGDSFDQGPDCFVIESPMDNASLEYSPGFMQINGQSLPAVNAAVLEKAGECSTDSGDTPAEDPASTPENSDVSSPDTQIPEPDIIVPKPDATTATSHARVQQQILSHPSIVNAMAQGVNYNFNDPDANFLRELIEGRMITYQGVHQFNDGLASIHFTLHQIYCPGGKFVMFKTSSESAFNPDRPSELNPFVGGNTEEARYDGVWETSLSTAFDETGSMSSSVFIMNMYDFSIPLAQQGQSPVYPQPGQGDIVTDRFVLTPERQALAPDPTFWISVVAADQRGVHVENTQELSPLSAAPNVCG